MHYDYCLTMSRKHVSPAFNNIPSVHEENCDKLTKDHVNKTIKRTVIIKKTNDKLGVCTDIIQRASPRSVHY